MENKLCVCVCVLFLKKYLLGEASWKDFQKEPGQTHRGKHVIPSVLFVCQLSYGIIIL